MSLTGPFTPGKKPVNYTPSGATLPGHLDGIDTALGAGGGSPDVATRALYQNNLGKITETGTFTISGVIDSEITGVRGHYKTDVKLENPGTPAVVQLPAPNDAQFAGLDEGHFCDIRPASGSQPASVTALVTNTFRHANGYSAAISLGTEDTIFLGYSRATSFGQYYQLFRETDIWVLYGPYRITETDDLTLDGPLHGGSGGIPATIVDAKGDLIVATAADTVARLAVGSNGQVPTADSAEATGVRWATPGAVNSENVTIVAHASGDTRAAIQTALDSVATAGGGTVKLEAGRVYDVNQSGLSIEFARTTPIRVCLFIDSGVVLDGNGSTIRLLNSQNAHVLATENLKTNTTSGSTGPTVDNPDIVIKNLTIDGNKANQSASEDTTASPPFEEMGAAALQRCPRLRLENIHVKDCQCNAIKVLDCRDGVFEALSCADIRGDAFHFGLAEVNGVTQEVFGCSIGNIVSVRCEGGFDFPNSGRGDIQGNPVLGNFIECVSGNWTSRNCGGGYKIENLSRDSSFGQLLWSGDQEDDPTDFRTANSGTKIQGDASGLRPRNIMIAQVMTTLATHEGLRMTDCDHCHVASYIGKGNGTIGNQDIFIDDPNLGDGATSNSLGTIKIDGTSATAVALIRIPNSHLMIGQITATGLGGSVDLLRTNSGDNMTIFVNSVFMDGGDEVIDDSTTGIQVRINNVAITGSTSQSAAGDNGSSIIFNNFVNNRPT